MPDAEAFEAMAAAHYPRLVRRLTLVVRDPEEARDLAQSTLERAFAARSSLDGREVGPWLNTIGLRLALNELRRRRRRPWLRLRHDVSSPAGMPDPDLWVALGELRREEVVALVLNALEGYTQAEIAEQLRVPEGTVASWISRAKARLRSRLEESDE
jgi:RNA polymerase sigma-70 factor (ECF subfamily)